MPPFNDYLCLIVLPASPDPCMPLAGGGIPTACTMVQHPEIISVQLLTTQMSKWV